jgi:hypothetical protein
VGGSSELADRLIGLLAKAPVVALDEAAEGLGTTPEELEAVVRELGETVGLLTGPPPVLFRLEGELIDA